MSEWNNVDSVACKNWLVLPTVYSDALSYGEQLDKFCYNLNKVIENNNILPDYVSDKIKEYISSGEIEEVVRDVIGGFILNVKYPPKGITPAVGDGSTDDGDAFQGCIDYVSEHGGAVYVPYGSYLVHSIQLKSNVAIFGFDRYSTKVVLKGGAEKALLYGENVTGVTLTGMTLDGNSGIQVNDVDAVNVSGGDYLFYNLIMKDGYQLLTVNGNTGNMTCHDIVNGNAVNRCWDVAGSFACNVHDIDFEALSKFGKDVIRITCDRGIYSFASRATCDLCLNVTGNNNYITARVQNAKSGLSDGGKNNSIEVIGQSKKEYYSWNLEKIAHDSDTTLNGSNKLTVTGNSTKTIGGGKSETVSGTTTETYKNTKTVNATNVVETLSGNKTMNAVDITETATGNINVTTNNVLSENSTTHNITTHDFNVDTYKAVFNTDVTEWLVKFPDRTVNLHDIYLPNVKSIKEYGCVGDGSTDNTENFKKAMESESVVYVPNGTYLLSNIELKSNQTIIGESLKAILKLKNNGNAPIFYANNIQDFRMANLTIDGNKDNQTDESSLVSIFTSTQCEFKNLVLKNGRNNNIYVNSCTHVTVDTIESYGCYGGGGIVMTYNNNDSFYYINNCYSHDNEIDGILCTGNRNVISNNICINNGLQKLSTTQPSCGIYLDKASQYNTITGNVCRENSFSGIELSGANHNIVSNNELSKNKCNGIYVGEASFNLIIGNLCLYNIGTQADNLYGGIYVGKWSDSDTAQYNNIIGNYVDCGNLTKYGIILNKSDLCNVIGNSITGNTESKIYYNHDTNTILNDRTPENIITEEMIIRANGDSPFKIYTETNPIKFVTNQNDIEFAPTGGGNANIKVGNLTGKALTVESVNSSGNINAAHFEGTSLAISDLTGSNYLSGFKNLRLPNAADDYREGNVYVDSEGLHVYYGDVWHLVTVNA